VLVEMVREGGDQFIEAQKKLVNLAVHQLEAARKAAETEKEKAIEVPQEARTTLAEVTGKSVQNFVAAQKSLMDLAIKPIHQPIESPARENGGHKAGRRPRRKKA